MTTRPTSTPPTRRRCRTLIRTVIRKALSGPQGRRDGRPVGPRAFQERADGLGQQRAGLAASPQSGPGGCVDAL
eukprot:4283980-Alexandrium_andersonii.AAC.1